MTAIAKAAAETSKSIHSTGCARRRPIFFQLFPTDLLDKVLQSLDPFDQPAELFFCDLVVRRVSRVDIGTIEPLEAASGKLRVTRPCFDQLWFESFG